MKIKRNPNGSYSMFDKREVKQLLIGKELRVAFDDLYIHDLYIHDSGIIKATHSGKRYAFKPDLTPIELEIEGELRVAFDVLITYDNGIIKALHNGKWYGFKPDFTPIARVINGERVVAFDSLITHYHHDDEIEARHNGKHYYFNADGSPRD